jgi:hypothetical protein
MFNIIISCPAPFERLEAERRRPPQPSAAGGFPQPYEFQNAGTRGKISAFQADAGKVLARCLNARRPRVEDWRQRMT